MKHQILLILLTTFLIISCSDKKQDGLQQGAAMPYPVIEIPTQTVTVFNSYPANIEGVINSEVRPKIGGYITQVLVDEGQEVKQGQLMFKLETQSLSQDAGAAKANINAAQVEVDKLKPLVDKNIISNVQLETAKAKLAQANSNYKSVAANIGYANIKSPVNGIVGTINYRKGALVTGLNQLPLTRVSSIKNVYAYFSLNEKEFLGFVANAEGNNMKEKIKNLPEVSLILANGEEYDKKGTIETISGEIDQQTGTVTFRALFDNSEGLLRNGSSGTIKVPKIYENATVVPILSTFEQQGKTFVYKVVGDSLVPASLDILATKDKVYVIKDGVSKGNTILAKGANKVKAGAKIKPNMMSLDSLVNSFDTVFK